MHSFTETQKKTWCEAPLLRPHLYNLKPHFHFSQPSLPSPRSRSPNFGKMEVWKICWKTNLSFQQKRISQHTCILCSKFVDGGNFLSSFVQDCVSCSKGHGWGSFKNSGAKCICSSCDRNLLLEITTRKQRCFMEGCEAVLEVNEEIVKERVRNRGIFQR
jgi:hypothetical protein